jgi:uncharacterized protein
MISKKELKEIIKTSKIPDSKPRKKYLREITPWLKRREIIILKGIRRCGKTNIMYQLMKTLPTTNVFYVDFEEFRFDSYLNVDLLEQIVKLRDTTKPAYFFLDEIQRVSGFEKWLRTYHNREEKIHFIIGGSNISLLTPNLATVLTGRNVTFEIYPLDYKEFQEFSDKGIDEYLIFGGFPEVVLCEDEFTKRKLLQTYVDDILFKDIITKKEHTNVDQIKALVKFFLNNPGIRISANKLGKQLGIGKNTAQNYINLVKDTFLIFEVPFFSYSAKTKYIGANASKYYAIDNGLHTITTTRENRGTLFENAVAIKLLHTNKDIFYWQDGIEIDFIVDGKALQVTATEEIPDREKNAFKTFNKKYKKIENIIISPEKKGKDENIDYIRINEFLNK